MAVSSSQKNHMMHLTGRPHLPQQPWRLTMKTTMTMTRLAASTNHVMDESTKEAKMSHLASALKFAVMPGTASDSIAILASL